MAVKKKKAAKKVVKKKVAKKVVKKKVAKKVVKKKVAKKVVKKKVAKKVVKKKVAKKASKKKIVRAGQKAIRYTEAKKQQVLNFIRKVNAKEGKGGIAQAVRKYNVSALTLSRWINKYGL
jgi:hypothetical protein